ncbi:MAG TPA: excinuclease ABC subunit UvrC [Candidatus Ornithocaccomicrobium faecavium]|uniref:UvrABC system protein C n=1 Tax=Candidatus Ornithocaccomicrobium faecavium TaxID=2840890 RepID=A0A9D1TC37_9FIRM|nr:excinuclease ABC subunit UvrC [Candidatus Ornithocaccomicrobium faecavium]
MNDELKWKIENLPDSPGCYIMKSGGEVIYVGKAKNLKNRVRQYFQSSANHTQKVRAMVARVDDFELMLVDSEMEAFTLECNLIKRYKPFYNILLKDDKHYPYLRVNMKEAFPRVTIVRRVAHDGAKYFGPYFGANVVRDALDAVRSIFPIRTCSHKLPTEKALRPCVNYEIGLCRAPCANRISQEEYHELMEGVVDFLGGKFELVLGRLKEKMNQAAANWNYERAAVYRDQITAIDQLMQKQKAIVADGGDQDVAAALIDENGALVQMMYVRGGRLIGSERFSLDNSAEETAEEALSQFIAQYYDESRVPPRELLVNADFPDRAALEERLSGFRQSRVHILVPQRGEKRKLILLAQKNLLEEAEKRRKRLANSYERTIGALEELKDVLGLPERPRRIEGYDISNTQGAQSVGSMVVMIDGVSANKEYRHFRIKTVEGPNDFASMREMLSRRLAHGLKEVEEGAANARFADFPDLILIDGGRGQLNAALEAMRESGLDIPMFGLAKRIEEIVLPNEEESIVLDRHSNALHLIQRLRDEAHRFGITHHRALRAKNSIASRLESIPSVGTARRRALLTHFRSMEALRQASPEEIALVNGISPALAQTIYEYLHKD